MVLQMWIIWVIAAVVMFGIEAIIPDLVTIWFGIGAVVTAVVSIFVEPLWIQGMVFVFVSGLSLLITRPLIMKNMKANQVKDNAEALIGKIGIVIRKIDVIEGVGQVKVRGIIWSAISDDEILEVDERVKIIGIEGVKLKVEKIIIIKQ